MTIELTAQEQAVNDGSMAHEISGITEGRLRIVTDGRLVYGDVTVAVSDKNAKTENNGSLERDGTQMVAISYTENNVAKYEVIDFVVDREGELVACATTFKVGDHTRQMGGFEDVSYNQATDTYYFVQEGGNTWDPTLKNAKGGLGAKVSQQPVIFEAKLVKLENETHAMQLMSEQPIVVPTPGGAYGGYGNGVEGMAVDQSGNIYVGFQDTGKIYKGTLNQANKTYAWDNEPVLETHHSDLAGMAFDSSGNLVVSFGSESWDLNNSTQTPNRVRIYGNDKGNASWKWLDKEVTIGSPFHDAEAVMVDHNNNIIAGSDNGTDTTGKSAQIAFVAQNTTLQQN